MSSEDEEKNWEDEDMEEADPSIIKTSKMDMEDFAEQEKTEVETTMLEDQVEVTVEEVDVRKASSIAEPQVPEAHESVFQEETLVQNDSLVVEADDIQYNASAADGEMTDDESMDSIAVVQEAAKVAAVTAGGAVMAVTEEEDEVEGNSVEEEAVAPSTSDLEVDVTITEEMKQVLRDDLKYTKRDIKLMRPEIASMVVYNKLLRPTEGMPSNWYIEGSGPAGPLREHAVKIAIAVTAVGGVAAIGIKGDGLDMSELTDNLKQIPAALAGIPAALAKFGKKIKKDAAAQLPEVKEGFEEVTSQKTFTEEEMNEMEDEAPHSIKPGENPGLMGNKDESALDKFLTKIEMLIKAFFNIKI
jgi:hypothetical protein